MKLNVAIPQLPSGNLDETEAFFQDFLGFKTLVKYSEHGFLSLAREKAEVHFWKATSNEEAIEVGKMSSCYILVDQIEELFKELKDKNVKFRYSLTNQPWGMKEFQIDDPFKNAIKFGEKIK